MQEDIKRNVADHEVIIYEAFGEESGSDDDHKYESPNEFIETQPALHEAALKRFLEPPTRANEPIINKIARVRKEIEEIRMAGAMTESQTLLRELQDALRPKILNEATNAVASEGEQTKQPVPSQQISDGRSKELSDLAELETRVASLESGLGTSARSNTLEIPVSESLMSIERTVRLLASDPAQLQSKINKTTSLVLAPESTREKEQINWLYKRLTGLDKELQILPQLISRLQTLRKLHSEAIASTENIQELKKSTTTIEAEIKAWKLILTGLETKVDDYIRISNANINKLTDNK